MKETLSFLLLFCLIQLIVDNIGYNVNKFVEISENKEMSRVKQFSCENHINHALDIVVAETGDFPILEKLNEEERLSTKCAHCEEQATYVVSSK